MGYKFIYTKAREKTLNRILEKFKNGKLLSNGKVVKSKKRAIQIAIDKARDINA